MRSPWCSARAVRWEGKLGNMVPRMLCVLCVLLIVVIHAATAQCGTSQDRLNQLILSQRFREVILISSETMLRENTHEKKKDRTYIHLSREALLAVTHHGVSSQSDNRRRW